MKGEYAMAGAEVVEIDTFRRLDRIHNDLIAIYAADCGRNSMRIVRTDA
jgi:hypothetical protein